MRYGVPFLLLTFLLVGCTAIDKNTRPADLPTKFTIGIYEDTTLDWVKTDRLLDEVQDYFWNEEGVWIEWYYIKPWERKGFTHHGITDEVWNLPLDGADKLLVLVGRNTWDFLWGLTLPEVAGAVFIEPHDKGYAVAEWGSVNQVCNWFSPKRTIIHEIYHLLGYTH